MVLIIWIKIVSRILSCIVFGMKQVACICNMIIDFKRFKWVALLPVLQGVLKTLSVNKLTSAGCKVKIWIADWFAQLNNKMGGDLKKIETVGRYLIEIWRAVGMDLEGGKVEFLWSSKEINSRAHEYWPLVMDIARRNKLPRIIRCLSLI